MNARHSHSPLQPACLAPSPRQHARARPRPPGRQACASKSASARPTRGRSRGQTCTCQRTAASQPRAVRVILATRAGCGPSRAPGALTDADRCRPPRRIDTWARARQVTARQEARAGTSRGARVADVGVGSGAPLLAALEAHGAAGHARVRCREALAAHCSPRALVLNLHAAVLTYQRACVSAHTPSSLFLPSPPLQQSAASATLRGRAGWGVKHTGLGAKRREKAAWDRQTAEQGKQACVKAIQLTLFRVVSLPKRNNQRGPRHRTHRTLSQG